MFIVFEGLDGAGKSTLMRSFFDELKIRGLDFIKTHDPGGTELSDKIRELILSKDSSPSSEAELLLYQASRADMVSKVIEPALKNNKWVISDRFYHSTLAFQGYARGLNLEIINYLNNFASKGIKPDRVIWLDTPVDQCQQRLKGREIDGSELNRLDMEKLAFHKKVREGYLALSKLSKDLSKQKSWITLDGSLGPEEIYLNLKKEFFND